MRRSVRTPPTPTPTRPGTQHWGLCRKPGHNRRTCARRQALARANAANVGLVPQEVRAEEALDSDDDDPESSIQGVSSALGPIGGDTPPAFDSSSDSAESGSGSDQTLSDEEENSIQEVSSDVERIREDTQLDFDKFNNSADAAESGGSPDQTLVDDLEGDIISLSAPTSTPPRKYRFREQGRSFPTSHPKASQTNVGDVGFKLLSQDAFSEEAQYDDGLELERLVRDICNHHLEQQNAYYASMREVVLTAAAVNTASKKPLSPSVDFWLGLLSGTAIGVCFVGTLMMGHRR